MLRVMKILEVVWLIIAMFSLVMGIYHFNTYGMDTAQWFFGGAFVGAIFYAFRRRMRLRMEREAHDGDQRS